MPTDLLVPDAPDPIPEEIWSGTPNVVLDGERYAIGWQRFPDEKGGPAYVTARRGIFGGRVVLGRYPLTGDGWALAWAEFAQLAPATAEKTRVALGRFYAARPPAGMLAFVRGLVLSAIDPPADGFAVGQAYDLRFGEGGLRVARSGSPEAIAEYRYADVAAVQVTGFERVLTASRMQLFFSSGTRGDDFYEYRIHLRVQTGDRILDFWRAVLPAKNIWRWLEPVNSAIRQARLSVAGDKAERQPGTEWLVSELSRLAERLEHGTLTRSDFDLLKARIIYGF
jgi:hypothetical protein